MNEIDLINDGFNRDEEGIFHKEVNGRCINCYRHPRGCGYWVCEIDTVGMPASNERIVTIEQVKEFIYLTCESRVISRRVLPR